MTKRSSTPRYNQRHYIDMAEILHKLWDTIGREGTDDQRMTLVLAKTALVDKFRGDNPAFDVVRFNEACGFTDA